ncbi:hypothetical protein DB30_02920 [Enhygromyxa salina]|uniref:Uncharacterized protein n=1 Tax=Enhygromyxa salina TaxID=215803 RepID=A0A0C2D7Q7_9BACT|nr:hypothetical protein [Enhygromyxa salina]KIG17645.1 hypothetical protein DB30_02920 [Enhygromyxa salina]
MSKADYRPGRRRKPVVSIVLDWAAGVLVGILLVMVGAGLVSLFVPPGPERAGALIHMSIVVWPIGAALGVWLSFGQPFTARALLGGLGLAVVGAGAVMVPVWLDVDAELLRGLAQVAALVSAPGFARLGVALARGRDD